MSAEFSKQYSILGIPPPDESMDALHKAMRIFCAACNRLGIIPDIPVVTHLPEEMQLFPVRAYQLQVIVQALLQGSKLNWELVEQPFQQDKWGPQRMNMETTFQVEELEVNHHMSTTVGGPRLVCLDSRDAWFLATECEAFWAGFCGAPFNCPTP